MKNTELLALIIGFLSLQFAWSQPGNYQVDVNSFAYTPSALEVEAGSTVTWVNIGGLHDVNFIINSITGDSFDNPESFELSPVYSSGPDNATQIGSWTFNVEGTYNYDCSIGSHALQGMVGTIVVIPQGEYPGCMDISACNFNNIANIDDGSCLYNDNCCNDLMNVECNACNACQSPENWCLNNPGFSGCDEYDVVGCMDDGLQSWSPFPGIAADNYAIGANTPCENCCAYWGCGNPDNSLMLVGTFMDLSGENGWNGTSMTVLNIWEDSQIYEMNDTVFYFSPSYDIMYELPPVPTEIGDLDGDGFDDADCCGLIDQSEFLEDGSENPNYGGPLPDGEVNHDDCLECPLNDNFVGELGYVVNFCAPEDLLDGCYRLIVDDGDPQQVAWQIQNADISVFALTGSSYFDSTSGAACTEDPDDSGFDFYDVVVNNLELNDGLLECQVCNYGNEITADSLGNETYGTTWVLIDGFAEISDQPSNLTTFNSITNEQVTAGGYYWGSCYNVSYDVNDLINSDDLSPGEHTITLWVNGGQSQPLGVNPEFEETFYENNYSTISFTVTPIYGCLDPWATNYNPEANSDNDGNEVCYYVCGDTDGDGVIDDSSFQFIEISMEANQQYPQDVQWSIQNTDGVEIISGGAPFDSNDYSEQGYCFSPDCYQLIMTDLYAGNGWLGDNLIIGDSSYSLENGSEETILFSISESIPTDCPCVNPDWVDPMAFCTFEYDPVTGCDGNNYSNPCVAQSSGLTSWTDQNGNITSLDWDCGLTEVVNLCGNDYEGCTNPLASNYDVDALTDDGSCDCGDGDCLISITVSVDMSQEGVVDGNQIKTRISTIDGNYSPSDWYIMDDSDNDLVFTYTFTDLSSGSTYGYNFNNEVGNGYENASNIEGICAEGLFGNDRQILAGLTNMTVETVCWESCEGCPEFIFGCTDLLAVNYNSTATDDDGSCIFEWPELANLFFSEYSEGSSNNKYLEIYNAGLTSVDLSGYSLSSCTNGCDDDVDFSWDYPDNVTFDTGTIIEPGDVYVICHGSSSNEIQDNCDLLFNSTSSGLSNGDDVYALTQIGSGFVLDIIGLAGADPGSGWDVSGVTNGTKDHTLVRKCGINSGNSDWTSSAGTNAEDSEWLVYDQDTWDYLGFHNVECFGCTDETACNYNPNATDDDGTCGLEDDCGICQIPYCYVVGGNVSYIAADDCPNTSLEDGLWVGIDSSSLYWLGSITNPYWNQSCEPTPGCTDINALNFWYAANIDDGSCYYTCAEGGLTDATLSMSTNGDISGWYANTITIGDNEYSLTDGYQTSINICLDYNECINIFAGGGIQQYNIAWEISSNSEVIISGGAPLTTEIGNCAVLGCTDESACNYDILSDVDDGSCTYPSEFFDCNGVCFDDDNDGICNNDEIPGCTNPEALNYDNQATDEDGSCTLAVLGCTDPNASNFNSNANQDDSSCDYGPWGEVPSTDCNMSLLIQNGAVITIEGEAVTDAWIESQTQMEMLLDPYIGQIR